MAGKAHKISYSSSSAVGDGGANAGQAAVSDSDLRCKLMEQMMKKQVEFKFLMEAKKTKLVNENNCLKIELQEKKEDLEKLMKKDALTKAALDQESQYVIKLQQKCAQLTKEKEEKELFVLQYQNFLKQCRGLNSK